MKYFKKAVSVFVLICLMAGMLSVGAFAKTTKDPLPIPLPDYSGKPYEYYTFLGDSVPAGGGNLV